MIQALMRVGCRIPRCVRGHPDFTAGVGARPATKRLTGISLPWSRVRPCAKRHSASDGLRLSGCGPHEADEVASYRRADHCRLLPVPTERTMASCKPGPRLSGDLPYFCWRSFQSVELCFADPRWVPVGPCTFNQHVAHASVLARSVPSTKRFIRSPAAPPAKIT